MNVSTFVVKWLGYGDVTQIDRWRMFFGAPWAHDTPIAVVFALFAAAVLAAWFYGRLQPSRKPLLRWSLTALRAATLYGVLLILADPILELTFVRFPQPVLWLLLDTSESMSLVDAPTSSFATPAKGEMKGVNDAVSSSNNAPLPNPPLAGRTKNMTRADEVRDFLLRDEARWLRELSERFRVKVFSLSGKEVAAALSDSAVPADWLSQWTCTGPVTALGDGLEELARRQAGENLAGMVLISDFDQNAGASPVSAARRLGAPLFTVGVGPEAAVDLAVDLLVPPTMKKAETSTLVATVRQRELDQTTVSLRVFAMPPVSTGTEAMRLPVGERTVTLTASSQTFEFPYTPDQSGRFTFVAEVDAVPGETVTQNNRAERDVRIIDDFLRLLFVEYEPTWEWRFIKEVFHRDRLVGLRGFRTFLRSADPVVRESNDLFLPNLTLPRSEFFEADVIFLGDMPASALNTRFCEMTREFVGQFGGGLVVIAGPRFGPGQLAETPLAELLPVVVDPAARLRDTQEYRLQLTPLAAQYDFMRLGTASDSPLSGWGALGKLPWYQPVLRVDPRATVLAEHPTAICADGKAKQPLIAVRPYGRGEVVYVGFNELWRLRRQRGEEYYRQFWGQLIHRLGLSHALGDSKRFVLRTDRPHYRRGETALVTVEAYNEDFEPLDERQLPERSLQGELLRPEPDDQGRRETAISLPQLRPGVFESRVPLAAEGEHRVRVTDPITGVASEISLVVANVSIELRNPVRNVSLQQTLAAETGGRSYDLTTAHRLLNDFHPPPLRETMIETLPLWSNWLTLVLLSAFLLTEWCIRKSTHLN